MSWPALREGPLTDFVPAAGLRWLLVGSPRALIEEPALEPLRRALLPDERASAFAASTGIDLRETERALVAGYDLGTLYLVDGSGWVSAPEQRFDERLAGTARIRRPHPRLWHVSGLAGSTPETLVRVDDRLLAVAVRDPTPARVVERKALGGLERVAPALAGAALSTLPRDLLEPGVLRFYAPGPFAVDGLPPGRLLPAAVAVGVSAQPDAGDLLLCVSLSGQWQPGEDDAHLRALWNSVANAEPGLALGLPAAEPSIAIDESAEHLTLRVRLPAAALAEALVRVFAADLARVSPGAPEPLPPPGSPPVPDGDAAD